MRYFLSFLFSLPFLPTHAQTVTERDFKKHFDAHHISGSFLLYDLKADRYVAYDAARCRKGFLPASTFKIPNTIIGLDTGVLPDTNYVFKWDGKPKWLKAWETDLNLAQAMRVSCVPCYQEVARKVGVERYKTWLTKMNYEHMDVGVANVDSFWLEGRSHISQFEQIAFLKRLFLNQLPVSRRSMDLTKALILLKSTPDYTLRGKTGLSNAAQNRAHYNGWIVGWLERGGNAYLFALNAEHIGTDNSRFIPARRAITEAILREMGLM